MLISKKYGKNDARVIRRHQSLGNDNYMESAGYKSLLDLKNQTRDPMWSGFAEGALRYCMLNSKWLHRAWLDFDEVVSRWMLYLVTPGWAGTFDPTRASPVKHGANWFGRIVVMVLRENAQKEDYRLFGGDTLEVELSRSGLKETADLFETDDASTVESSYLKHQYTFSPEDSMCVAESLIEEDRLTKYRAKRAVEIISEYMGAPQELVTDLLSKEINRITAAKRLGMNYKVFAAEWEGALEQVRQTLGEQGEVP